MTLQDNSAAQPDPEGVVAALNHALLNFDTDYRRACQTSEPDDWHEAALSGQRLANVVYYQQSALAPKSPAVDAAGVENLILLYGDAISEDSDDRRDEAFEVLMAAVARLQAELAEATAARAVPDELRAAIRAAALEDAARIAEASGNADEITDCQQDMALLIAEAIRALITQQTGDKP